MEVVKDMWRRAKSCGPAVLGSSARRDRARCMMLCEETHRVEGDEASC